MAITSTQTFSATRVFGPGGSVEGFSSGLGQLGFGLPNVAARGEGSRPPIPPVAPTPENERFYGAADLYGASGRPSAEDIQQDRIGDCFFIATAGAVADRSPDQIQRSISYSNETGNFSVELYDGNKWVSIEVTPQEIKDNIERCGGSKLDNGKSDAPVWSSVMEVAYAKLRGGTLEEGYKIIDKGGEAREAMQTITGTRGDDISRDQAAVMGNKGIEARVRQALQEGRPVTLSTDPEYTSNWFTRLFGDKDAPQDGLVDNHVYVVDGIRLDQNGEAVVRLRNPWQRNDSGLVNENTPANSSDPFIEVRMSDIIGGRGFECINIGPK
jgi:hypothetical protein